VARSSIQSCGGVSFHRANFRHDAARVKSSFSDVRRAARQSAKRVVVAWVGGQKSDPTVHQMAPREPSQLAGGVGMTLPGKGAAARQVGKVAPFSQENEQPCQRALAGMVAAQEMNRLTATRAALPADPDGGVVEGRRGGTRGHLRFFAPRLFPGPFVKATRARSIMPMPALAAEERRGCRASLPACEAKADFRRVRVSVRPCAGRDEDR